MIEVDELDNSDNIFSPPKVKKKLQRRRLTSDSLGSWEVSQQQATPCPDLSKTLWLADMLATLDVLQVISRGNDSNNLKFICSPLISSN